MACIDPLSLPFGRIPAHARIVVQNGSHVYVTKSTRHTQALRACHFSREWREGIPRTSRSGRSDMTDRGEDTAHGQA